MDGVGIGLAFQVSPAVGLTVVIAVTAHDFCDGLTTMSLMLIHRHTTARSLAMLGLDALAPALGATSTLAFAVPPSMLVLYLGFFAGLLLYIGASDILQQVHSMAGPAASMRLLGLTPAGVLCVDVVMRWSA